MELLSRTHLLLSPAVRLAHVNPARHVRHEFPLQATCFRQVLPHVRGFPTLRVLCLIRLPKSLRRAFPFTVLLRLPCGAPLGRSRFQYSSVSGFPLPCLISCIPYPQAFLPLGAAGASRVLQRISSCMPWPVDSGGPPHPHPIRMLRIGFVHVKTLAVRNKLISKLYQLFRTRGHPYGLQDSLSTLRLSCSPCDSSTDARLDTGGWLTLIRRGLSPRKIRQASPGTITFTVRGAQRSYACPSQPWG